MAFPSEFHQVSNLLFCAGAAKKPASQQNSVLLTAALKRVAIAVWKAEITTQKFRQLTIAITEKHVVEVYRPINRFDDRSPLASANVVYAW